MVKAVERSSANYPERCSRELFKDWLNTENGVGPKTWKVLLEQLKKVELADNVEEIAMMVALKSNIISNVLKQASLKYIIL